MGSLVNTVLETYNDFYNYNADPLAAQWPLVQSPMPIVVITITYLLFVLKLGPSFMKNRAPFELYWLLVGYNAFCVAINIFVTSTIFMADNGFFDLLSMCHNADNPIYTAARSYGSWWFYISKLLELFDTMFMILRKKHSQITFFHVFHHTFTMLYVWGCVKVFPGTQGSFHSLLNSGVHIIMYTYYMFAALGPQYRKYLWWKKYLTQLQLAQFLIVFVYLIYVIAMDCNLSKGLTYYEFMNCLVFIYFFTDFYAKEYAGKKKKQQQEAVREKLN